MDTRARWFPAAFSVVLALLVLVAFYPSFKSGYLWDDDVIITENQVIRLADRSEALGLIWRGYDKGWIDGTANRRELEVKDFFPLTYSLIYLQYQKFGDREAPPPGAVAVNDDGRAGSKGFHVVSVLLHMLAVVLVYHVLRALRVPAAELAAALFAVHPMVGTSVLWISEQKNTLSLIFYALSTLAFITFAERGRFVWYVLSITAFSLALLAKPSGIALPIFFALYLALREGKSRPWLSIVPFLLLSGLFAVSTVWFQKYHAVVTDVIPPDSLAVKLQSVGVNIGFYFLAMAWPTKVSMVYPHWSPHPLWGWLPDVVLVCAFVLAWRGRARVGTLPFLALSFVFLMLLPVLGFVSMSYLKFSRVADHLAYLAAIGILALYAAALHQIGKRLPQALAIVVAALLLGALMWLDHGRCMALARQKTCWIDVLEKYPTVWVGHAVLGHVLNLENQDELAMKAFREQNRLQSIGMSKLVPDWRGDSSAHYNLGVTLLGMKQFGEAEKELRAAIKIDPGYVRAHNMLGVCFMHQGRLDEANRELVIAVRIDPTFVEARTNLGVVLLDRGRPGEAVDQFDLALRVRPTERAAALGLIRALSAAHRTDDGLAAAVRYLKENENDAAGWVLLAGLLLDKGDTANAQGAWGRVQSTKPPGDATFYVDMGLLAARFGETGKALDLYRKAEQVDPKYALAINNQAWVLATARDDSLRNGEQAVVLAQKALAMQPDDPNFLDTRGAAAAEAGRFDDAIEHAQKALARAKTLGYDKMSTDVERHLESYKKKQPWRE